ncbi:YkgB family protein [Mucilaginibacter gilvus]|uniref:DUF417 family protein n=1 Tax=Mucilaginibacter gilvus TaxID=2305909 RepID=A0A444MNQ0_9SPHI|nr:DUF417 family protein [Mucilaginibacter gilvus]RWY51277.1 DUF417 family protein [Mucilaginibacter gilvus]
MKTMNLNEQTTTGLRLENIGAGVIRYGLAIVLIWIGILKFTTYEAEGIKPLVDHSPLLGWAYNVASVSGFSMFIGFIEILSGILIACRNYSAKASLIGSSMAVFTFVITLTFLLSTPGIIQPDYSFPFISPQPGQFLLKDIVLFGAALWSAGEALRASNTTAA